MTSTFRNVYDDPERARAYAAIEFPGTYYLAFRDLPAVIGAHVRGRAAVDFGCGTGRSTRFLRTLGFDAVGVDIAAPMLALARERGAGGRYLLVPDGDLGALAAGAYDLALSAFTFDNVPTLDRKIALFQALERLLGDRGRIVSVVSTPEIYVHEWASFSTRDFPENRAARSGEKVSIVIREGGDPRPVTDVLCTDEDYREVYRRAGLELLATYRPLAKPNEPFRWVSEVAVPPWAIYVLGARERSGASRRGG
jgi:SAM-dependent methyltransferase